MIRDKKPYSILIIEDNAGDFAIVEDFLSDCIADPIIIQVKTFKEAALILTIDGKVFDIILLDLTLPDKSGQNLVNDILKIAVLCPVIILTGFTDIEFSMKSISLGISDYLLKDDLNAAILYKSILYTIERKRYIKAMEQQNQKLQEIASMQSHMVRAPLTRMMGIVNIVKDIKMSTPEYDVWINHFIESANELDTIIQDIVKNTERVNIPN